MRFLIDAALSLAVAQGLRQHGHDTVHVRERGLQRAPDEVIFALAAQEERVVVSADTDFGTLLAQSTESQPSVILFRRDWHEPQRQVSAIIANLPQLAEPLMEGAVVVFDRQRIRIRKLPISP